MGEEISDGLTREDFAALGGAVVIALGRIYDVLISLYTEDNEERAKLLLKMHKEGRMFFPPPSILIEEEDVPNGGEPNA